MRFALAALGVIALWLIGIALLALAAGCAPKDKHPKQPPPVFIGGGQLAEDGFTYACPWDFRYGPEHVLENK